MPLFYCADFVLQVLRALAKWIIGIVLSLRKVVLTGDFSSFMLESVIEVAILLIPVIPLFYGALHPKSDFFKALRFHDRGLYESDTLLYLLTCFVALSLHAAGQLRRSEFCIVALITILVFENAVIGKFDCLDEISFALSLSVLVGSRFEDISLPAFPIQYLIVGAVTTLEVAVILPQKYVIYPLILCLAMSAWHIALCKFKLQFTFLEYFSLLSWTSITILALMKYESVSSEIRFDIGEVLYVAHSGVACVFLILFWIGLILNAQLPLGSLKLDEGNTITLRCGMFLILFTASIPLILMPSLRYILDGNHPISWVIDFMQSDDQKRLYLCIYWLTIITLSVSAAQVISTNSQLPKFCNRKLFHLLMVLIMAPTAFIGGLSSFMILAMGVAFCAFLVLETFRVLVLVPAGKDLISSYYLLFLEDKENQRPWISSNITLLLGCAIPLFLWGYWSGIPPCSMTSLITHRVSICSYQPGDPNWEDWTDNLKLLNAIKLLLPHLGWIIIGVGDSFAAVVGSQYGRNTWVGTNRTVEGSIAMFLSMMVTSLIVIYFTLKESGGSESSLYSVVEEVSAPTVIIPITLTFLLTSLLEAFTRENDNLILPMFSTAIYVGITAVMIR